MNTIFTPKQTFSLWFPLFFIMILMIPLGCGEDGSTGDTGATGPPGDPALTETDLLATEDLPGLVLNITSLSGASGQNGNFQVGDTISVTFTLTKGDGSAIGITELDRAAIYVSGPSVNYQRVIASQGNVAGTSVKNTDGSYTYTFADPIPATYLPPYNDTTSFDSDDGELQGQNLLPGTYTIGMEMYKIYNVGQDSIRDVANATFDFLFGTATTLEPREVVGQANCNNCHKELQVHGGFRRQVKLCLLCHTSGAEDRNVASAAGGTPGASIDMRVMIHKIHNGAHLPSVNGVGTNSDGTRDYTKTPEPYRLVGFGNRVHDYSKVSFPVWPNLDHPLPRDAGYSGLSSTNRGKEDQIRTGAANCAKCHGDPDGSGPLSAPAQGDFAYQMLTRRSCGSCHDDIDWTLPYKANNQTMSANLQNFSCSLCHTPSGGGLSVKDAHLHPLNDTSIAPGVNFALTNLEESGTNDSDNTLDTGEKISISFTIKDDSGTDISPSSLASITVAINGPSTNRNILLNTSIPTGALTGGPTYTINVPEVIYFEFLDTATGSTQVVNADRTPIWTSATTTVYEVTGTGSTTTLSTDAPAYQNFIDVASVSGIDDDDYLHLSDSNSGNSEYLKVRWVDTSNNRIWFTSTATSGYQPSLRLAYTSANTTVTFIDATDFVQKTAGTDYNITDASTGEITLVNGQFSSNNPVIVSYTSDFVVPDKYPTSLNDTPSVGESYGEWRGKDLVDGTYNLAIWGWQSVSLSLHGENNSYRDASPSASLNFLVGSASTLKANNIISSENNCLSCHNQLVFHGGTRRGFDSCLVCHGTAGSEDRPVYISKMPSLATDGVTIDFREMLHRIHMGKDLPLSSTYQIIGFGNRVHTYENVGFPAQPDGTKNCTKCHGMNSDSWKVPADRSHPSQQNSPIQKWKVTCNSCHNSVGTTAHIALQTTMSGQESCSVCHGEDKTHAVELEHKTR